MANQITTEMAKQLDVVDSERESFVAAVAVAISSSHGRSWVQIPRQEFWNLFPCSGILGLGRQRRVRKCNGWPIYDEWGA